MTTPTNVRFEYGMSMPDYQARPEISCSDLKAIGQDPARWRWDAENPKDPTDAMILGSAVHGYVLEPDNPSNGIVETEHDSWRTADAKAIKTQALAAGGYPLRAQDVAVAKVMATSLRANPRVARIMSSGTAEVSFFGLEGFTPMRGRLDWINPDARTILDVKIAESVNPHDFARVAYDKGYHLSAAHYLDYVAAHYGDAPEAWTFVWAIVGKHAPFEAIDAEPSPMMLDLGRLQKSRSLWRYQHCMESGHWGFGRQTQVIEAPGWALRQEGLI